MIIFNKNHSKSLILPLFFLKLYKNLEKIAILKYKYSK